MDVVNHLICVTSKRTCSNEVEHFGSLRIRWDVVSEHLFDSVVCNDPVANLELFVDNPVMEVKFWTAQVLSDVCDDGLISAMCDLDWHVRHILQLFVVRSQSNFH